MWSTRLAEGAPPLTCQQWTEGSFRPPEHGSEVVGVIAIFANYDPQLILRGWKDEHQGQSGTGRDRDCPVSPKRHETCLVASESWAKLQKV